MRDVVTTRSRAGQYCGTLGVVRTYSCSRFTSKVLVGEPVVLDSVQHRDISLLLPASYSCASETQVCVPGFPKVLVINGLDFGFP